jgi:membrane-associated phospholipid phosphatase
MTEASAAGIAAPAGEPRPWGRAALWLIVLVPVFFATYGAANWLASRRAEVGAVVFSWEHQIPFVPWTIVPYWSIDLFYGLSLFVCATRDELDTHARRLLTAQLIAVACFILFPLRFTFVRPAVSGVAGFLFDTLAGFDKPFNQAPSLHIALLVILWVLYARHVPRWALPLLYGWFALVGLSVLTTYQHHFIDLPTGVLLGFACLWLWPDQAVSPLATMALTVDRERRRLAGRYAAGAAVLAGLGVWIAGAGLWLLWPALSLALVAVSYAVLGAGGFQQGPDGRMSLAARGLLAPYRLAAWVNARLWTRGDAGVLVRDGVSIGRLPLRREAAAFTTLVSLCAELSGPGGGPPCRAFPMLDLATPEPATLRRAAASIAEAQARGPVLVCCALGYSRSAAAVATWLLASGRAATVDEAVGQIRRVRPRIVLDDAARTAIAAAAARGKQA